MPALVSRDRPAASVEAARACLDQLVRGEQVPGIQYVVVGRDRFVFEHTAGRADIAGDRRLDAETTMMAYSMSKPVTAAAVLTLVDANQVELDAPIDRYVETQPYGPDVTVRELLSHTSGIPNPIPLRWVHAAARHGSFDEHSALARVLLRHPALCFEPGMGYRYSNVGYWLLGAIVERTSGKPFQAYVREHVLQPLRITQGELGYVVPNFANHAKGYLEKHSLMDVARRFLIADELVGAYEGRWLHLRDHYVDGAAFGGLVGNARGFGKFLQDQLRPRSAILSEPMRQLFHAPQHTKSGVAIPTTLGWHTASRGGAAFLGKEGGGAGFHAMMRAYLSCGVATVALTNATRFDVGGLLDVIDPVFL